MSTGSRDTVRPRTRATACMLTMMGALWIATALPAGASEVVDLRIGAHPDFTRVVFELDRPTGYRIERAASGSGRQELVVSLDATSIPRKVHSEKSLIGLVRITPEGGGSVARIELVKDGLNLKEMILANPPRIVLDVLRPASERTAKTPAAKPKRTAAKKQPAAPKTTTAKAPAPTPKKLAAKPAPKPVRKPTAKPAPAAAPKPSTPTRASAGTTVVGQKPSSSPTGQPTASAQATPGSGPTAGGVLPPQGLVDRPAGVPPGSMAGGEPSEGGVPTMGMNMQGDSGMRPTRATPPSAAERVARRAMPPAATSQAGADDDSGIGMGTVAGIVGAVVLLAGGVVFMRRRGGAASDADDDEIAEGAPIGDATTGAASDNPFAGLAADSETSPTLSMSTESASAGGAAGGFDLGGVDDDDKPATPVDGPMAGNTGMQISDADTLVQGVGATTGSAVAGLAGENEGDEEVMRIISEFERRMASLESRLDEVVDARERLERQVAAQTEELRVQRAAIARTQRAVRNMNRPDEEGPTEPALRDPQ